MCVLARRGTTPPMRFLVLAALCAAALLLFFEGAPRAAAHGAAVAPDVLRAQRAKEFETCAYQRADAADCVLRYGDLDGDDLISPAEADEVKRRYLSWVMRAGAWLAEKIGLESTAAIFKKCDYDRDGFLSRRDFELASETCLVDCARVNQIFEYVCNKAIAEERARAHAHAHGRAH